MHRLDRSSIQEPTCLSSYQHGRDSWSDVTHEDKEEVRSRLEQLQGRRCAYCEGDLDKLGQHIEHFVQKGRRSEVTFLWSNLFWACDQADRCGRYKDKCKPGYNDRDLIKPDEDDPDHFLHFISDGSIRPRAGLSPADYHRAKETLRVFKLDEDFGKLRAMRREAIRPHLLTAIAIAEIAAKHAQDVWLEFWREEVAAVSGLPFTTAIRHALTTVDNANGELH